LEWRVGSDPHPCDGETHPERREYGE